MKYHSSGGPSVTGPQPRLDALLCLWPLSNFKANSVASSLLSGLLPPPSKEAVMTLDPPVLLPGSSPCLRIPNLITSAKFLVPCSLTYAQGPGSEGFRHGRFGAAPLPASEKGSPDR